ncbi:hypothetical protein HPB52_008915 [Rhipicephalus sanguineus]|uniref:Uncharacterized protein n=1 Tax=Rhipicephalus sanguineus TaxID=34632 RepID=A0A9D4Q1I1_RHISA|nr:hypothetical protein HPB52_008915 [Rhipicephalus sanguineus]
MTANNVKKVTQLPTRVAPTLSISGVKRSVTDFGQLAPDGKVLCVDLGMYTKLASGAKALRNSCEMFMPDHWGVDTAIVPISITGSGSRWAAPYVLSFVGTEYWNLKVYYELKCKDSSQSQAGQGEVTDMTIMNSFRHAGFVVPKRSAWDSYEDDEEETTDGGTEAGGAGKCGKSRQVALASRGRGRARAYCAAFAKNATYNLKFKRAAIAFAEDNGNHSAAAKFGMDRACIIR